MMLLLLASTLFGDYYINHGKKEALIALDTQAPFSKNRALKPTIQYYKNRAGQQLGIDKNIIVSFLDLSIQLYIEKEFSLALKKRLNTHMFVYQVKKKANTLDIANTLSKIKGVAFAHPDFIIQKKKRTNDPLYNASWHLHGGAGINVEEAWRYTKGQGIIVGLYDEGIDIEHEDLRANIIGYGNYNYAYGQIDIVKDGNALNNNLPNAPQPAADNWHGTSCAGLIAASGDNRIGGVGVAPQSKLLALRYANENISRDIEAFYAMSRNGAAIISNSWGTYEISDAFNAMLKDLSEHGRDGKGTLIFFASGNGGCNMDLYYSVDAQGNQNCASSSQFPSIRDESESPYVISIAASTDDDRIANYSNYGSAIDFAAPGSSIITTDATGSQGTTGGSYTYSFSGTSAAAPIAAGAAALVLAENPTLSKEEVLEIFKNTADKNGEYRYINGRNDHWGYGRINVGKAVVLASQYGKSKVENFAHKIYQDMH